MAEGSSSEAPVMKPSPRERNSPSATGLVLPARRRFSVSGSCLRRSTCTSESIAMALLCPSPDVCRLVRSRAADRGWSLDCECNEREHCQAGYGECGSLRQCDNRSSKYVDILQLSKLSIRSIRSGNDSFGHRKRGHNLPLSSDR